MYIINSLFVCYYSKKEKRIMYNTLKEIQNSLSDKDFNKYVGKLSGKTAEEIGEDIPEGKSHNFIVFQKV